jgi:hypothetical protein
MRICRTAEGVRVVSASEVLVMLVTTNGRFTARNISEWHKIMERRMAGKGSKGGNRQNSISK